MHCVCEQTEWYEQHCQPGGCSWGVAHRVPSTHPVDISCLTNYMCHVTSGMHVTCMHANILFWPFPSFHSSLSGPPSLKQTLLPAMDTFLHNLGISKEEAEKHQLYCHEAIELNEEKSPMISFAFCQAVQTTLQASQTLYHYLSISSRLIFVGAFGLRMALLSHIVQLSSIYARQIFLLDVCPAWGGTHSRGWKRPSPKQMGQLQRSYIKN